MYMHTMQALKMQLKKKGMCDFIVKHNSFGFEKNASPSVSKNPQSRQVLRLASENQGGLLSIAMEPEDGEVCIYNNYHSTHGCHDYDYHLL